MKRLQCKLRTASAVEDWLNFVRRIENLISSQSIRVNGKRQTGFYTAIQCDVEPDNIVDVLTEYIAFLENRPTLSFEIAVQEADSELEDKPPAVAEERR